MIKALMVGGGFQHQETISINNKASKNFKWVKNNDNHDIKIFIDNGIYQNIGKSKENNFAWLFESRAIFNSDYFYSNIELLSNSFELIFTCDKKFLQYGKNFVFAPANSFWVKDIFIRDKKKLTSFITSNKNKTIGHNKRLTLIPNIINKIDIFGIGYNYILNKELGLDDYMFSICIENDNYGDYFTEKILDCFATGTIPIYWGCDNIGDFFDENGIIKLTDDFDFTILNSELYYSKIESIKYNLELVKKYEILEDYIYNNYLKKYDK